MVAFVILEVEMEDHPLAEQLRAVLPRSRAADLLVTPRPKPPVMIPLAVCPGFGFDWLIHSPTRDAVLPET